MFDKLNVVHVVIILTLAVLFDMLKYTEVHHKQNYSKNPAFLLAVLVDVHGHELSF